MDVFFILDCSTKRKGDYLEHENRNHEMVLNIRDGDIEVYIRKDMVGWFTVEKHENECVVVRYEDGEEVKRIGAVTYLT